MPVFLITIISLLLSCTKPIQSPVSSVPPEDSTHKNVSAFWILYATWQDETYQYDEVIKDWLTHEAPRRDYLVMNAADHRFIATAKAANPNIKLLMYKDFSAVNVNAFYTDAGIRYDYAHPTTGVGYVYADTYHPEWFLKDADGNRIVFQDYPDLAQIDVGDPNYQKIAIDTAINVANRYGWDGIFADDVLFFTTEHHTSPAIVPAKYPTDASFQAAYNSFLTALKTKLNTAAPGKIVIGNMMTTGSRYPDVWKTYLQHLDGALDESWVVGWRNEITGKDAEWKVKMDEASYFEGNNKILLAQALTPLAPKLKFYYAYASYLLVRNKTISFSEMENPDRYGAASAWRNEYNWNLGNPSGAYFDSTISNVKLSIRNFDNGMVIVNPNSNSPEVTLQLANPYINEDGQEVIAITVSALSGRILRKPVN